MNDTNSNMMRIEHSPDSGRYWFHKNGWTVVVRGTGASTGASISFFKPTSDRNLDHGPSALGLRSDVAKSAGFSDAEVKVINAVIAQESV